MSNLLEKASILLTPTAYDDGSILSVKPIDGSGDFQFTRNSSATRVNSQGLIEDMQTFGGNLVTNGDFSQEGSELITNGDFANDSDWAKLNTTISDGKGNLNGDGQTSLLYQNILTQDKFYKVTFTVSDYNEIGNALIINNNGIPYYAITTNGTFTTYFKHTISNGNFLFRATSGAIFSIDNVSVKEVGQDWDLGTGWSIGDGKATFENSQGADNLIQTSVLEVGKYYKLTFDTLEANSTTFAYSFGSSFEFISPIEPNSTYTVFGTASSTSIRLRGTSLFNGSITNVSVIEITDDTNLPRIDYSPYSGAGTCGHWLFEPQSTNLFPYSNDFSQWDSFSSSSVINNVLVSPDGTLNADEFVFDGTNNGRVEDPVSTTNGLVYTFSIYLKNKDIANPTQVFIGNATASEGEFVTITNEWQRFTTTQTANNTTVFPRIRYNGVGSLYAYGAQFEQQSYATSYIPTSGSTVTRNQEAAFGAGSSDLINSTEGVLYAEISALANENLQRWISLSNGTTSNTVKIGLLNNTTDYRFACEVRSAAVLSAFMTYNFGAVTPTFVKVAFKYSLNDFALWVNGVEVATDTSGNTPIGLNKLSFNRADGAQTFFGKTKCLAVFKEALTDAELTCLTTI